MGLCDLVSSHIGFVEIMDEIDGEFDQKVPLSLRQVRVTEPFIEMILGAEPKHSVATILHPISLFPFLYKNRSKRDSRQDVTRLHHHFSLGQW